MESIFEWLQEPRKTIAREITTHGFWIYEFEFRGQRVQALSLLHPMTVSRHWLREATVMGELEPGPDPVDASPQPYLNPADFRQSPAFMELFHEVIGEHAPSESKLQADAREKGEGTLYYGDGRAPYSLRMAPPDELREELRGSFQVQSGRIVSGSYRPNSQYRLLTRHGLASLGPNIKQELWNRVTQEARKPAAGVSPAIQSAAGDIEDPGRWYPSSIVLPDGYWCYQIHQPGLGEISLTLLEPEFVRERGLSRAAIVGVFSLLPDGALDPQSFHPNILFLDTYHAVIAQRAPSNPSVQAMARSLGEGELPLVDPRTADPHGPVVREDLVGIFQVVGGQIRRGSYRANIDYYLLTGRGLFIVPGEFREPLIEAIKQSYEASEDREEL